MSSYRSFLSINRAFVTPNRSTLTTPFHLTPAVNQSAFVPLTMHALPLFNLKKA
jgi:hypothetical protein